MYMYVHHVHTSYPVACTLTILYCRLAFFLVVNLGSMILKLCLTRSSLHYNCVKPLYTTCTCTYIFMGHPYDIAVRCMFIIITIKNIFNKNERLNKQLPYNGHLEGVEILDIKRYVYIKTYLYDIRSDFHLVLAIEMYGRPFFPCHPYIESTYYLYSLI